MADWLRFFRVVNLPAVPGDVLVGAVAVFSGVGVIMDYSAPLYNASLASICIYLFGVADSAIVLGSAGACERSASEGGISLRSARFARFACLAAVIAFGGCPDPVFSGCRLPLAWWFAAVGLLAAIAACNRTRWWGLMGLCRGLNALCGGLAAWPCLAACGFDMSRSRLALAAVIAVWALCVAVAVRCCGGGPTDAAKRRGGRFLAEAMICLQLGALVWFGSELASLTLIALVAVVIVKMAMKADARRRLRVAEGPCQGSTAGEAVEACFWRSAGRTTNTGPSTRPPSQAIPRRSNR